MTNITDKHFYSPKAIKIKIGNTYCGIKRDIRRLDIKPSDGEIKHLTKRLKMNTLQRIQMTVIDYFNAIPGAAIVSMDDINLKTRRREVVQVRQVAMYFAKKYTRNSLSVIGSGIGGKDHATVLHSCKTVNNLYDTNKHFRSHIDELDLLVLNMDAMPTVKVTLQIRLKPSQYFNGQYKYTLFGVPRTSKLRTIFMGIHSVEQAFSMINEDEIVSLNIHCDYRIPEPKPEYEATNEPLEVKI